MLRQIQIKKNGKILSERISFLHKVTATLLDKVKALDPLKIVDVQNGVNFYEEVARFEIYLIECALEQTGGNQLQASRLLNIKYTTLNTKIKRLQISTARSMRKNSEETNGNSL